MSHQSINTMPPSGLTKPFSALEVYRPLRTRWRPAMRSRRQKISGRTPFAKCTPRALGLRYLPPGQASLLSTLRHTRQCLAQREHLVDLSLSVQLEKTLKRDRHLR